MHVFTLTVYKIMETKGMAEHLVRATQFLIKTVNAEKISNVKIISLEFVEAKPL